TQRRLKHAHAKMPAICERVDRFRIIIMHFGTHPVSPALRFEKCDRSNGISRSTLLTSSQCVSMMIRHQMSDKNGYSPGLSSARIGAIAFASPREEACGFCESQSKD